MEREMSTKKQIRRERREKTEQGKQGRKVNPATVFMVGIVAAVVVLGVFAFFFQDESNRPPWPGAVWSPEHNHWH
jgi:hypothetical protein